MIGLKSRRERQGRRKGAGELQWIFALSDEMQRTLTV